MEFLSTRRDLINWFIKNEVRNNNTFSGQIIIKKYRELKDKLFCKQVFKDECYEKYWILGNIDGIVKSYTAFGREKDLPLDIQKYKTLLIEKKRFVEGEMELPTSVRAPANALSRLCGELANMYQEGLIHRFGRGIYCILSTDTSSPSIPNVGLKPKPKLKSSELVGKHFHSYDEKGTIVWQGRVLFLEQDKYFVQLFDWFSGEPSREFLVSINEMSNWSFYSSAEEMIKKWKTTQK